MKQREETRSGSAAFGDVVDPIGLSCQIRDRYLSYLETTFYFRDPDFRKSFQECLRSGALTKGPFLEGTPAFERTVTPRELVPEVLGFKPEPAFVKALHADRRLFWHQEQAIRLVSSGKNVIVATGTGSGKTEAFLYSILLSLYREHRAGRLGPGVRALVLYPMNALAYDQRERLGAIAAALEREGASFRFTFGQYIGATPENERDTNRSARQCIDQRQPGELVTREEMRSSPPHILLTNYSMLEYLLLRPFDSPLFQRSQETWTFLVLDEAHQYRGSKGHEMAMLLRRLKARLRPGGLAEGPPFRCIATSATLASGEDDVKTVVGFASELFGEPFGPESLVLGRTVPIESEARAELPVDVYPELARALACGDEGAVSLAAARLGVELYPGEPLNDRLARILRADRRAERLRLTVSSGVHLAEDVAREVFAELGQDEANQALARLAQLLTRVHDPATEAPMLSARYHYFLRSLEGAFVSFHPSKTVQLTRTGVADGRMFFEAALCRQCGQHYLVGRVQGGYLREANRDPSDPHASAIFFRPVEPHEVEESLDDRRRRLFSLCAVCGAMQPYGPYGRGRKSGCGHDHHLIVEQQDESKEAFDQIPRCSACGYRAPDPVREVVHGSDGPNAVIATTLCESLPKERRRVLAFADSRQEAAFFAWYLEDSYRKLRTRNLILRALRRMGRYAEDGVSLSDLADALSRLYEEHSVYPSSWSPRQLAKQAWIDIYREFLTEEARISLEGVGLVRWFNAWLDRHPVPPCLLSAPWDLTETEARAIVGLMMDMARADGAFDLRAEKEVDLRWDDFGFQRPQTRLRLGKKAKQKGVVSWDAPTGRRARFLAEGFMKRRGMDRASAREAAEETLREIWNHLTAVDAQQSAAERNYRPLLEQVADGRRFNPEWWRIRPAADGELFSCETCGHIQVDTAGTCSRYGCYGRLIPWSLSKAERNHYRDLYETLGSERLRVEEHTAQLSREKAKEFQEDFKAGHIDLLSSSTTFELGVDLGDLDVVFLRNVPPEPFNYVQRVGRAGRRSGYPGIAVTYCRRASHDLYHFAQPERMLKGETRLVGLTLRNTKIAERHLVAVVLGHFFRRNQERFRCVAGFCNTLARPRILDEIAEHIDRYALDIEKELEAVFPDHLLESLGVKDRGWPKHLLESGREDRRLADAVAAVSADFNAIEKLKEDCKKADDFRRATWAKHRSETIQREDVIGFLSRHAVIPKYGFPVDVVELDLQKAQTGSEASTVTLERDLSIAISEYALGCEVVANKKTWKSIAIKRVPARELDRWFYRECRVHHTFSAWRLQHPAPPPECGCSVPPRLLIVPRFGFVGRGPQTPRRRPGRVFSARPRFLGLVSPAGDEQQMYGPVRVHRACPGEMLVVCEGLKGQGFYICPECGCGSPELSRLRKNRRGEREAAEHRSCAHENPRGGECDGIVERVSLGHHFITDVLRIVFPARLKDRLLVPTGRDDQAGFALSLAYALLQGTASSLQVPPTDINVTLQHGLLDELPAIVLYDDVPGGAGLVSRLEEPRMLRMSLEAALDRVSGRCGCSEDTSCYGCLRSFRNQFAHQQMQRGPVRTYLEALLAQLP